jgi:flagellar protein FlaG
VEIKAGGAGGANGATSIPSLTSNVSASDAGNDSQTVAMNVETVKTVSKEDVAKQVEVLNKVLQSKQSYVKFVLHDQLNEYFVQIVDNRTDQVIKEIPSKKMMDTVAKMYELIGILVDQKR